MVTIGEYEGLGMMFSLPACSDPSDPLKNLKTCIADAYSPEVTSNHEDVQKKLFDYYTKDIDLTNQAVVSRKLVEFLSDYLFNKAVLHTAKSCTSDGNDVYMASFDYFNTDGGLAPQYAPFPFKATTHGSDAPYVFGDAIMNPFNPTGEQLKVMDMMGQFVGNFVKYGNPNGLNGDGRWEKFSLNQPNRYFKIDYPMSEMRENFQNGRLEVYTEIEKDDVRYRMFK